jgi:glycosyltransferase involved in cell wall biosynthesis
VVVPELIHVITPGDHYSPRTGSATSTVVHGLSAAAQRDGSGYRPFVVLDVSTMHPRYDSATPIEYAGAPAPSRRERMTDVALGRMGLPRRAAARYFRPAADAIVRRPPAIVLAHNAPVLTWLLRESPHRVVLYAHNDLLGTYTRAEAMRMLGGVAGIVAVSDSLAERLRAQLPQELERLVRTVGNGVDCDEFTPARQASRREPSGAPLRVLFVGRIVRDKGPDVLVQAANILARDDLEFLIVGSQGFDRGAPLSAFETDLRRSASRGSARVGFEPFTERQELAELMRSADVLVVPSRWQEPSGLTAGEGLASGLAVVASRVGGIPEVVGSAGRYVSPDDPDALAEAIAELADDAALRQLLGSAARRRALEHDWSWAWSNLRGVLDTL